MNSFADIIDLWPSAVEFADDLDVNPVTARSWRRRGIPGDYWESVVEAAGRRGFVNVTLQTLARLGAKRRAPEGDVALPAA